MSSIRLIILGLGTCFLISAGAFNTPAKADAILSSLEALPKLTLASLGSSTAQARMPASAQPSCTPVPAPVQFLDTRSKYSQSGAKDVVDGNAKLERERQLRPVRSFLRSVRNLAFSGKKDLEVCAAANLQAWARASALTYMRSDDANLTKSRFMAEISLSIEHLERRKRFSAEQSSEVRNWIAGIARSTVRYFKYQAGPKSRRNNHRYWAALAVGAAGYLSKDQALIEWAHDSAETGLCQVDDNGYLSLEIQRGRQARNYHIYALRPLGGLVAMSARMGDDLSASCNGALAKLARSTFDAIENPKRISEAAGTPQAKLAKETDFVAPLRLGAGTELYDTLQQVIRSSEQAAQAELATAPALSNGKG